MASIMSDAPLSKEEQEEEEMRQELKDVGLYYENMSIEEMRQLVNVLNESKNDSRKANEDEVDDSALFGETRSTQETSKAAEDVTKRPIPSFSYKQAVMSGTINQDSPPDEIKNTNDTNLQASPSNSFEKNYTTKSPDSESIYDRNSNFKKDEDYPTLSSRYKTRSTTADTRTRTQESKKTPAAKKASLERWALDPLEFVKDKKTTPLCHPEHSESDSEENLPYCSEAIDLDSEEFDKLCQQMDEKLGTLHKQCLQELEASQKMAAPIKINHEEAPVNKPSVNKPPVKEKSFSINTPGPSNTSNRNASERASKRKALSTIAAATELFENDENSNDESSNTKKRKFQQANKEEEVAKRNQENQKNKNVGKSIETISIDDSKDNHDTSFDDPDFRNMRKSSNKKVSNENKSDEAQSQYPRRVTPPNPGKKNYKGPRAKNKNNSNSTLIESKSDANEKKKLFLNDDDIQKTLQEIDEQIEDGDCVEITNDIKPPSASKRIGKRLSLATNHLENARELKEQKLKAEEEAKQRREKEERLKKDALICSRLQEEENERSRQLEKQRKCDEQAVLYKNILSNKSRVTRSNFQQKKTEEEIAEDLLLDGDDDEPTITRVIQKQLCPICQKPFPADEIETHASGCDAYAMDSNEAYNRPSTSRFTEIHKCQICDRFETQDGNAYEEHVVNCKNRPRSLVNGGWIY